MRPTSKKHKTISANILAQTDKFNELTVMARQLIDGNYFEKEDIEMCEKHINFKWNQLMDILNNHQKLFSGASELLLALKEAEVISKDVIELSKDSNSSETNRKSIHLPFDVEGLIQNRNIFEAEISSKEETIEELNSISVIISGSDSEQEVYRLVNRESPHLSSSLQTLNTEYTNVSKLIEIEKQNLNHMRDYYRFIDDIEEEESTICERQRICQSVLVSKDLLGALNLQQKHELLVIDIKKQKKRLKVL